MLIWSKFRQASCTLHIIRRVIVALQNTIVPALLYATLLKPNDVIIQRTSRPALLYSAKFEQQEGVLRLQVFWSSCHFIQPEQFWRFM